jgi:hypothetical protein
MCCAASPLGVDGACVSVEGEAVEASKEDRRSFGRRPREQRAVAGRIDGVDDVVMARAAVEPVERDGGILGLAIRCRLQ